MSYIKSKDLSALMECQRKYMLQQLSFKNQNGKNLSFRIALSKLAESLAERKNMPEIREDIENYLETAYQEEWFYLSWQKEKTIKRDMELLVRFLENFLVQTREAVRIQSNVGASVKCPIDCKEVAFQGITGNADLLMEMPDGSITGVILCRKFLKPYSYRARKLENKVESSIELITLLGGLMERYPKKRIKVMMVRMLGPSDTVNTLSAFEGKKGEHIIELTSEEYLQTHPQGVEEIKKLIAIAEPCSCKDCNFEDLCRPFNHITIKKDGKSVEKKKNISFSKEQKLVINHRNGPLRVCAGPGSGKTAVLVERIQRLVEFGVEPERILAITFTKKAAQEMQERVRIEKETNISTLHALALRILTRHEYLIGTVRLAGMVDCKNLLMEVLEYAPLISGVSYDGLTMKYGLIATLLKDFDFINKHGLEMFAISYPKKDVEGILKVKELYDAAFMKRGYITFDDQIAMAVNLLKEYPGILESVQNTYDYVMVDEVQDLDEVQAEFVRLLVRAPDNNIMICGDADQSIYAFRGGSSRFMLDFPTIYPEAEDIWLQNNYRSSAEIVALSAGLIAKNKERVPLVPLASFSTGARPIHIPNFYDKKLARLIREIHAKGYSYGEIAVISRTNKELLHLCELADQEAAATGVLVPLERPKLYLREDWIFQMFLDLLELSVHGMEQDEALYRLLNGMGCNVEKENRRLCIYEDHLNRGLLYDFYSQEASRYYLKEDEPLRSAYGKIYHAMQLLKKPLKETLWALAEDFFPKELCVKEVLEKIEEMVYERKIIDYGQLYKRMCAMKTFGDDTRIYYSSMDQERVHMLTAHDAKGKEFQAVILYGIDNFEEGVMDENRRLLYVAVTRAKKVLFVLENYPGKSTFLQEVADYITVNRRERFEK